MEAIAIVLALVALGMLSMRFGYDSRGGARSKEEELASLGMTWGKVAAPPSLSRQPSRPLARRPRALAVVTRMLARA